MTRPSVSVALCTHNGARFVERQVLSILNQDEPPRQVVLSDDASTDDTVARVEALWAAGDLTNSPELIVLRNETPLGVSRNFQQAVEACSSDLVALSDQDDVWRSDRVRLMIDQFASSPAVDLVFTDARLIDEVGTDLGSSLFEALEVSPTELTMVDAGAAFSVLLKRNIVTGATVIFRRSLLRHALPFEPTWVHDEWLAVLAAAVSRISYLPDQLVGYRQHGGNQIGVSVPTLRYKIHRVFEQRDSRYLVLEERASRLLERLELLGASAEVLLEAQNKLVHQRRRAALPAARIGRVIPVLREAATGRYARYSSQGNLDILRDLLGRAG